MSEQAWLAVGVVLGCLSLMMSTAAAPELILLGGVVVLLVTGVLTAEQALSGFSNEGMITVALMYVVVAGTGRPAASICWSNTCSDASPCTRRLAETDRAGNIGERLHEQHAPGGCVPARGSHLGEAFADFALEAPDSAQLRCGRRRNHQSDRHQHQSDRQRPSAA